MRLNLACVCSIRGQETEGGGRLHSTVGMSLPRSSIASALLTY